MRLRRRRFPETPPTAPAGARSEAGDWVCEVNEQMHADGVRRIRDEIAAGNTYLVNLTTRFRRAWSPADDPFELYRGWWEATPAAITPTWRHPTGPSPAGSPELFFEWSPPDIVTRPMKGTAPARTLVGRRRVARPSAVHVAQGAGGEHHGGGPSPQRPRPHRRAGRRHRADAVRTRAASDRLADVVDGSGDDTGPRRTAGDLRRPVPLRLGHRGPKVSTMSVIADLETITTRGVLRGRRARPTGATRRGGLPVRPLCRRHPDGCGRPIPADRELRLGWRHHLGFDRPPRVGGGAPQGSGARGGGREPGRRRADRDHGLRSDRSARAAAIRHLGDHLARLGASARYFGLRGPDGAPELLADAVAGLEAPARVRLVLRSGGAMEIETSPLHEPDPTSVLSLCLDTEPVDSSERTLFHKTTDRARYDERTRRHPTADDVILVNERGEVTETTRATLAVRLGDQWCTPPLRCGLLPGIQRARDLADGRLVERVITVDDLLGAHSVATLSSLRGWRAARVVPTCVCQSALLPLVLSRTDTPRLIRQAELSGPRHRPRTRPRRGRRAAAGATTASATTGCRPRGVPRRSRRPPPPPPARHDSVDHRWTELEQATAARGRPLGQDIADNRPLGDVQSLGQVRDRGHRIDMCVQRDIGLEVRVGVVIGPGTGPRRQLDRSHRIPVGCRFSHRR